MTVGLLPVALDMLLKVSKVIAANTHDRYNHTNDQTGACTDISLFLVVCVTHSTSLFCMSRETAKRTNSYWLSYIVQCYHRYTRLTHRMFSNYDQCYILNLY